MDLQSIGKFVIVGGLALVVLGGALLLAARLGLGSLPGDFRFEGRGWGCYLPIATSLLLSLILTLLLTLLRRWFR